jgi:hypothetical protein
MLIISVTDLSYSSPTTKLGSLAVMTGAGVATTGVGAGAIGTGAGVATGCGAGLDTAAAG